MFRWAFERAASGRVEVGAVLLLPDRADITITGGDIIKKSYESPRLTVHGTVEQVTQGTKILGRLDGTYNQNQVAGVDPIAQS